MARGLARKRNGGLFQCVITETLPLASQVVDIYDEGLVGSACRRSLWAASRADTV